MSPKILASMAKKMVSKPVLDARRGKKKKK